MSALVAGLSYLTSTERMRSLLGLIPFEGSRRLVNVSRIMERRSKEIIAEKKVALEKEDMTGICDDVWGKDIMSILRKSHVFHPLYRILTAPWPPCSQTQHGGIRRGQAYRRGGCCPNIVCTTL